MAGNILPQSRCGIEADFRCPYGLGPAGRLDVCESGGPAPFPSAKAPDAHDKSNNTTASIRFILFSLVVVVIGEAPKRLGEQFSPSVQADEVFSG